MLIYMPRLLTLIDITMAHYDNLSNHLADIADNVGLIFMVTCGNHSIFVKLCVKIHETDRVLTCKSGNLAIIRLVYYNYVNYNIIVLLSAAAESWHTTGRLTASSSELNQTENCCMRME